MQSAIMNSTGQTW